MAKFVKGLFLSAFLGVLFAVPASAARVQRPITYWTSKGASWNQSYPQDGIDFAYNSEGNNWYITPTPFRYSEASWAVNLWFLRGWFSTSQSLANKRGARFTLSVIMYPNDDSNKWTCGDRSGLLAYVTGDNVTSRAEHVRCQKYDSDTFRLWATFTLTPTNGEVFSSNPNLYFTFESEAKDLGIFNFDGYVVSSGLTSVHQNALMLVDHVDEDDLVLFTDPNTGLLENVVDKLDQQTEVIEREGADIRSSIDNLSISIMNQYNDYMEDQKAEYEAQADANEDTINDDSSAAQSTATSLLSVVGQFIGALTSAQPTSCVLNGNLIPHLPLGQLDLCQNNPPAVITIIGSLILIAVVVPLAFHAVKRMLALIGSFQN